MKKIYIILLFAFLVLPVLSTRAQDIAAKLNEAEKEYSAKNLDNARFALQGALLEINRAVGKQILEILPKNYGNLPANLTDDNFGGAAGIAGLFVNRSYGATGKAAKIEVLGDSPLLTTLNALLSMPAIMASSDPNQKRIKVSGYKSLLQKGTGNNNEITYTVQVPMNTTLVSVHFEGFTDENEVISLAGTIPLDQIAQLAK
ncbi:MAG: hypothetical protein AB9842_00600 [Bacteroidales bacterium]